MSFENNKYKQLYDSLKKRIPDNRLYADEVRRLAFGTDASFYRLIPKLVVKAVNEDELIFVIGECNKLKIPFTFRTSGTSLSGQAITDSVLIKIDDSWNKYKINDDASKITLDPAITGGFANAYLAPFNKKIGPDPASINAARITGIVSNNASGMTSGVLKNSYHTIADIRIIMTDGTILDTGDNKSREDFLTSHKEMVNKLLNLSSAVKNNEKLSGKIRRKFKIKNTTGYSINALIDFDDVFEIIKHLMVGSEGTLAFISKVTFNTVENPPFKASALMIFKNIKSACTAIPLLKNLPVDAAEIMDRTALRSVEDKKGMPRYLKELSGEATALLVETSSYSKDELWNNIRNITQSLSHLNLEKEIEFTDVASEYIKLWNVRKGLFTSVSKARNPGTTVIIEDVNFDTAKLADAVLDLQSLFKKHGYKNTIIWGHALSGNIHFVFFHDFSNPDEVVIYKNFINDLTKLVVEKYDGSLKAEHGTGRNMAPFVKYEWGDDAYDLMKNIKKLFDPENILSPGVLINNDTEIHIKNLKPLPIADPLVDKCIECGFCENVCPSKDLTLTPRQRIVVYREISRLSVGQNHSNRLTEFKQAFDYLGDKTCATDGLCELSCPVDIDTGKLIKKLREKENTYKAVKTAEIIANNLNIVTTAGRVGLNVLNMTRNLLGDDVMQKTADALRKLSNNKIPKWNKAMPKGADLILTGSKQKKELKVVYFPSCISRTMGLANKSKEKNSQSTIIHKLLEKAGYEVIYPDHLSGLCCGMPFASKGFVQQANRKANELEVYLQNASNNGEIPVVFDTSPCSKTMKDFEVLNNNGRLKIYDSVEFIHDFLLPKLKIKKVEKTVAVHPVCSVTKMGLTEKLITIAKACATNVVVPEYVTCCGFAGDRGFNYPELNESALKNLKPEIEKHHCTAGYSSSKTCEIGLSLHAGINYNSIAYLVDECSE